MRGTLVLGLFICFINLAIQLDIHSPRGPRPQLLRREKSSCSEEDKWPVCSDDDLGPNCPSGCRMQGKIEIKNIQNDERVKEIRQMLKDYSEMYGSSYNTVQEVGNRMKQSLDRLGTIGESYYQYVDRLNSRLITVQNRINEQVYRIKLLRNSIVEQFKDITRLEVDIDIKIRACKGSCDKSFIYHIDKDSAAQLEKNYRSLTSLSVEKIHYGKPTHAFKMRQLKDQTTNKNFKSSKTEALFSYFWEEANENEFTLEKNIDDSKVETKEHVDHGSAVPDPSVKIIIGANGTSSSSQGDGKNVVQSYSKTDTLEETPSMTKQHFSHSSDIVTTQTITSKDGSDTKTFTTEVSESFPSKLEHFHEAVKIVETSQNQGPASSTKYHFHDFGSLLTSETKSTISKSNDRIVHTKTIIDDLDDFSNLGEHSDFTNLNIRESSIKSGGISSSTKGVRVSHETEEHRFESSHTKGLTTNQGVKMSILPNDESGDNRTSYLFQPQS